MATYAFTCQACGEEFEVKRPMSERSTLDSSPPACPACGSSEVQKLVTLFTAIRDWRRT
jgi:putative FmdB family regulatory protein